MSAPRHPRRAPTLVAAPIAALGALPPVRLGGAPHAPPQGLAEDGQSTEGIHSLLHLPAAGASWLELAFCTSTDERLGAHPRHVLKLDLPLGEQ